MAQMPKQPWTFWALERDILGNDDENQLSTLQIRCVNAIVQGKSSIPGDYVTKYFYFSPLVLREIITLSFQEEEQDEPDDA